VSLADRKLRQIDYSSNGRAFARSSKLIQDLKISLIMNKNTKHTLVPSPKKAYKTPKLKVLGSVKKLTLKIGSGGDGFGTFAP
jgi:hypothetical protein